jgi:cytochrome c553
MVLYFLINQLPSVPIDPGKFPAFDNGLVNSMLRDADDFLNKVLWTGTLNDLLLSKTAFVNTRLANDVYKITPPAGATVDNFVEVTLPATQRAGILTNAAFLTARGRSDGLGLVIPRGKTVKAAFLCLGSEPPDLDKIGPQVQAATAKFTTQTGQEQVADRAAVPLCASCHATFDSYGLVLEFYDNLGVYRTNYPELAGMPAIDGTTTLPAVIGGASVKNAVELADQLVNSPTFTNCMATSMLQYAMTDLAAKVDMPLPPTQSGCAATDVAQRYASGSNKTYSGMLTAVTQSPAFLIRKAAP